MTYRLRTLLTATAGVAIVLAALSRPSEFWSMLIVTATFWTLGVSVLGAILLSGRWRGFWLGFAVLGGVRFLVDFLQLSFLRFPYDYIWPDAVLIWLAEQHTNAGAREHALFMTPYLSTLTTGLVGGLCGYRFAQAKEAGRRGPSAD